MANLSQVKRERMLAFIDSLKEQHKTDDETLIALGEIANEIKSKRYGLVWEEHEENVDRALAVSIPVFTEVIEKEISLVDNRKYNFLLEGDNLHSLYLLEKTHKGAIDAIYIDPPYNTGNEDFIYSDKMIGKNDGYKHSKWLSFMSPRLKIARNLLSEKGVIFISIDDNEQAQLKMLCDEIFGEENYENIIWKKKGGAGNTEKILGCLTEYIHCYFKKKQPGVLNYRKINRTFKYEDEKGKYNLEGIEKTNLGVYERPTMLFPIKDPATGIVYRPSKNKRWTIGEKTVEEYITEGKLLFDEKKQKVYRIKRSEDYAQSNNVYYNLLLDYGSLATAKDELYEILGDREIFDTPKPTELILHLLEIGTSKNSIILDFFAGSGTTGHAVMKLNEKDGGNRRYILCTNNENNICEEVTYKRLQKVMQGYGQNKGIKANLKYYKTDFISKDEEFLSDALLEHIKEMIQLEHGIKVDGKNYLIILDEDELDELEKNWEKYSDLKAIYRSRNVLPTTNQMTKFSNVEMFIIPDHYFDFELKEVGETW